MRAPGGKFGRKKEDAIAALLTQRNIEEAAKRLASARIRSYDGSRCPSFNPPTVKPAGPHSGKPSPDSSKD